MRPNREEYYLGIALAVSKRSTCLRRHYGAVIVNNNEVISTGYNGGPRGGINCCDTGVCMRVSQKRNSGYEECKSVHAEQNAIISASRQEMLGATLYLACEYQSEAGLVEDQSDEVKPCPICERMIKNAGIKNVVTRSSYKSSYKLI